MRCLVLTPFVPFPPDSGGRIRSYMLLRGLAERHDVEVLTMRDAGEAADESVRALRDEGFRVEAVAAPGRASAGARALVGRHSFYASRFRSPAYARRLDELLEGDDYEVVQCELAYTGPYIPAVRAASSASVVLDEHNVEFELAASLLALERPGVRGHVYRAYARREVDRRRDEELAACRLSDRVVVVSDHDHRTLANAGVTSTIGVVPNGVELEAFPFEPGDDGRPRAVFVGALDYRPNADAVEWFCSTALPLVRSELAEFELTVVGGRPPASARALTGTAGLRLVGGVPDVRPYLRDAMMAIVPLRAGGGTRLKILEAFAAGTPVVSTSLGCRGLEVVNGRDALVADAPADIAAAIVRLVREPGTRKGLAERARALVEARYTWASAVTKLHDVYDALPRRASGGRPVVRGVL